MAGIYKVSIKQRLQNHDMLNVYHYVGAGNDATSSMLEQIFRAFIIEALRQLQSTLFEYVEMAIEDLFTPEESIIVDLGGITGSQTGESLPAFVNYGFQLKPALAGYRSGRKAISGVLEGDLVDGLPAVGVFARVAAAEQAMHSAWVIGGSDAQFFPVVLNTQEGGGRVANPLALVKYRRVSTQNTRKPYTNPSISLSVSIAGIPYEIPAVDTYTVTESVGGKVMEDWVNTFGVLAPLQLPEQQGIDPIPLP